MAQLKVPTFWGEVGKKIFFVLVAAFTNAFAMKTFLIPAHVYAAGINGISQLMSSMLIDFAGIQISTGLLILLFNIPIAILGWYKIGRDFTVYSFITVVVMSFTLTMIPSSYVVTDDAVINAVAGGVISGLGVGLAMKYGFSTGGLDIVSLVLAKTTGRSVGNLMLTINGFIILIAGLVYGWEYALYTMLFLYVNSRVIDAVHTRHQKVTAMIVTSRTDEMIDAIHGKLIRGLTVLPAKGGYSKADNSVLMIVITRYEMYDLEQAVKETDSGAFVNILETSKILGEFWDMDQQKQKKLTN